jgi:hypothetical protein
VPHVVGLFVWPPTPSPELDSREAAQFGVAKTRTGIYSEHAGAEKDEARCLGGATDLYN